MNLSERMRILRKQKNFSQEKIAELLGISRQSVSKWETGLSQPDTKHLIQLAEIFGISLDELTGVASEFQHQLPRNPQSKISKLAITVYLIVFGSIVGFFCPPISNVPLLPSEFWIGISVVSGFLLIFKNRKLARPLKLQKVLHMDIGIIFLVCAIGIALPYKMGLIKAILMTIPSAIYMGWVLKTFFAYEENQSV